MPPYKKYIATNFAYGTGPYLRMSELAIAVNNLLEKQGHERLGIIVPIVYGEKQKRIMREEFGEFYKKHRGEIIFDETLGKYLKTIFYGSERYADYLARWIDRVDAVQDSIRSYLKNKYSKNIVLELHRSPRVRYNVAPSYFVSFAYISKIYGEFLADFQSISRKERRVLSLAIPKIEKVENSHHIRFLTEPGTFSYLKNGGRMEGAISIPPTISLPFGKQSMHNKKTIVSLSYMERKRGGLSLTDKTPSATGIFVMVTGIPGLERLYQEAKKLGIIVYSNDMKTVPFAKKASPHILPNKNILFQFARSGWSSIWLSLLSGTPLVVPAWDKYDDPEIYFNNICIENLGFGVVYRGESLKEILKKADELRPNVEDYNNKLIKKFGTFDGTRLAAEQIAKNFIRASIL